MSVNDEMSYRQQLARERENEKNGRRYFRPKEPETIPWHDSLPESIGAGGGDAGGAPATGGNGKPPSPASWGDLIGYSFPADGSAPKPIHFSQRTDSSKPNQSNVPKTTVGVDVGTTPGMFSWSDVTVTFGNGDAERFVNVKDVPKAGTKHDDGKPPMQLVPMLAVNEVAKVLGFGAKKYEEHNWRKGLSQGRLLGAALRHQVAYLEGEDNDPESQLAHLAHAACCILFALDNHLRGRAELDDRYKHPKK